jgi:hypothetical protein
MVSTCPISKGPNIPSQSPAQGDSPGSRRSPRQDGPRRGAEPAQPAVGTAAGSPHPTSSACRVRRLRPTGPSSATAPVWPDGDAPDRRSPRWFAGTPPAARFGPTAHGPGRTNPGRAPQSEGCLYRRRRSPWVHERGPDHPDTFGAVDLIQRSRELGGRPRMRSRVGARVGGHREVAGLLGDPGTVWPCGDRPDGPGGSRVR